jgi:hypothetical protein
MIQGNIALGKPVGEQLYKKKYSWANRQQLSG